MNRLKNDENGDAVDVIAVAVVILIIGAVIFVIPYIIGWAVTFLLHIFTGDVEITAFWTRWFIGVAIMIVGAWIRPTVYHSVYENACNIKYNKDWRYKG